MPFIKEGTRHLWATGAGIIVIGYASKFAIWEIASTNINENLAVAQKKNVADYQRAREESKTYSIPKEYLDGINWNTHTSNLKERKGVDG